MKIKFVLDINFKLPIVLCILKSMTRTKDTDFFLEKKIASNIYILKLMKIAHLILNCAEHGKSFRTLEPDLKIKVH